ncbi:hypothetical protein AMECASPLE_033694, partial [Ameca splendens]
FLVVLAISFQKEQISYSLLINPSSLFSIRQDTGDISLTRTLDYESDQRRYLLMVRASEEPGSLSTATEVQVLITDENDCVPEFLQSIYSVDGVPETVTTATSLLQATVEKKNSLLTGRNHQQNQAQCGRPSATTDWGFERTEQRHKENKEALIQESFLWEGKVNVNGCSSFSRFT